MFGAWQAGAWQALAPAFRPDLVVGASVGSLNGYAIAAGWSADQLCAWWRRSPLEGIPIGFQHLPETIHSLMAARPLEREYAAVLTNLLRLQPRTFVGREVTARHLLASCALPGFVPPQQIDGSWYLDGGLLNPLPVWAAVELGATHIVALNALPEIPSALLKPFVKLFRAMFGHNPALPADVKVITILPSRRLGSLGDALHWKQDNIERWLEQGAADARAVEKLTTEKQAAQKQAAEKPFPL
jgi:predicted acylesterase/phospholipase RssA